MAEDKLFTKYIKNLKGKGTLLFLIGLAVLLLLVGGERKAGEKVSTADAVTRTEEYRRALTDELTALCRRVNGVGEISMVITLDGTEKSVYATDVGTNGKSDYVVSGGEGLLLYREHPAVLGVAVVCGGGGDPLVRQELTSLIAAALNIGSNRIYVGGG